MEPIALSSNGSSAKPVHLYQKCYDIDNRENTMIHGKNRDPLSPHAVFVFPYEVERLIDVCVCV